MTIDENVPLKYLTTMRVGGDARFFCVVKNKEELKEAAIFAQKAKLPIFVLGGGSNVLVSDEGFHGLVIKMALRGKRFVDEEAHTKVHIAAGEHWDSFVKETVERGLWGLENLSGIPGSVGAAPVQNIGAYGVDVSSFVDAVEIFDLDNFETRKISGEQCRFGYRESLFKRPEGKNYVITEVSFKLKNEGEPNIAYKDLTAHFEKDGASKPSLENIRKAVLKIRSEKFPPLEKFGSAGSFFKNPIIQESLFESLRKNLPAIPSFPAGRGMVKLSLAWILDKVLGFKGEKMGHVGLYERQPLVLVNYGDATAHEIGVFADKIAHDVKEKTGVAIEREVQSIGEEHPPHQYQTWFWTAVYAVLPRITKIVQAAGFHSFRQNYSIGFLKKNKTAEDFAKFLHKKGYSKAYMAWIDPGEVLSVRKIVKHKFQYHIRLFSDGEARGHYEYTPEANPIGHLYEVVFTNPKEYFSHLLHSLIDK